MKKSLIACVVMMAMATGCAVGPEVHKHQAQEAGALKEYHKAEKEAIKATQAVKVAAGALVAATAIKMKADADMAKAKEDLETVLKED